MTANGLAVPGTPKNSNSSSSASANASKDDAGDASGSAIVVDNGGSGEGGTNAIVTEGEAQEEEMMEEGYINCCFSFTIRRDKWGIPSMIVGNFIRC